MSDEFYECNKIESILYLWTRIHTKYTRMRTYHVSHNIQYPLILLLVSQYPILVYHRISNVAYPVLSLLWICVRVRVRLCVCVCVCVREWVMGVLCWMLYVVSCCCECGWYVCRYPRWVRQALCTNASFVSPPSLELASQHHPHLANETRAYRVRLWTAWSPCREQDTPIQVQCTNHHS